MYKSKGILRATTKAVVIASAGLGALGLMSSSVFAGLTATADNTSGGSVTTGTLKLTQAASSVVGITGGFLTAIAGLAPGDTVKRYIDLTNTGTLDAQAVTLATTASIANALTTNGVAGLQVAVNECAIAWTNAGVCTPASTVALASTSLLTLASAQTLSLSSIVSLAVNHLQFVITLPAGSEVSINGALPVGTVQGLNTSVTWNFAETLRTNTVTNN